MAAAASAGPSPSLSLASSGPAGVRGGGDVDKQSDVGPQSAHAAGSSRGSGTLSAEDQAALATLRAQVPALVGAVSEQLLAVVTLKLHGVNAGNAAHQIYKLVRPSVHSAMHACKQLAPIAATAARALKLSCEGNAWRHWFRLS